MIPADIGPHPAAPNHYISFGKPVDWDEKDCGTLTVRRVGATGDLLHEPAARVVHDNLPSGEVVYPCFLSEWTPTPEEIGRMVAGQPVRVLVCGNALPPMSLWTKGTDEI